MGTPLTDEEVGKLLKECSEYPDIYNRTSNRIYKEFGLQSAVLQLICTWCIIQENTKEEG